MTEQGLKDKVSLIVGASSGIGAATARAFAAAGTKVAVAARRQLELQKIAESIGPSALCVPTDVQDADQVNRLMQTVREKLGRIDILVYAAGTNIPDRSLKELTNETWQMMLQTNLSGAFYCTQRVLPIMRAQKSGLIIYISSAAVHYPDTSGVSYQAGKHGLRGLAHGTFQEEKSNGIRTSLIFPGFTDTPLAQKRPEPTPPDVLSRALQPGDVAAACLFICSLPERATVPEMILLPTALS